MNYNNIIDNEIVSSVPVVSAVACIVAVEQVKWLSGKEQLLRKVHFNMYLHWQYTRRGTYVSTWSRAINNDDKIDTTERKTSAYIQAQKFNEKVWVSR